MSQTIRFHLDEQVDPRIAAGLRLHGVDVTTTANAGLLSAGDDEHVAFALGTSRVILTHDTDYIIIHKSGAEHAGIVYCHQHRHSIGEAIRRLVALWANQEPADLKSQLRYL